MEKPYKYTSKFNCPVKIARAANQNDIKLAIASSLDELRKFLPEVKEEDIDLFPIAFPGYVVNQINANGDGVLVEDAIKINNKFINKFTNLDHDRERCVGVIVNAGYGKYEDNSPLTESQIKDEKQPFNCIFGAYIWKSVNEEICELIESSNDPKSPDYLAISASFEVGFTDYKIAVIKGQSKNLADADIIEDEAQKEKLSKFLVDQGGNGKLDENTYVYRVLAGEVYGLGMGLVGNPASRKKGVATKLEEKEDKDEKNENHSEDVGAAKSKENATKFHVEQSLNDDKTSQNSELPVIPNTSIANLDKKPKIMLKSIKELNDENLKEVKASNIQELFEEGIKKASEDYVAEKNRLENEVKASKEAQEKTAAELTETKTKLVDVEAALNKINEQIAAQEKQAKFSERMASFDAEYELDEEIRKVIVAKIRDMSDEAFAAYKAEFAIICKERSKAFKAEAAAKVQKDLEEAAAKAKETKADVKETKAEDTTVLDDALKNSEKDKTKIPNAGGEPSLKEKMAKAFSLDGFEINKYRKSNRNK